MSTTPAAAMMISVVSVTMATGMTVGRISIVVIWHIGTGASASASGTVVGFKCDGMRRTI